MKVMLELKGTQEEQGMQLWELLRNNSLTEKELAEIFPTVKNVIPELLNCIKIELQNSKEIHKSSLEVYNTIAVALTEIINREDSTSEDRKRTSEQLMQLAQLVQDENKNYQTQKNNNINTFIKIGSVLFGAVVLIMMSKNKK